MIATHVVAGDNGDIREDVIVVKHPEHPLQLDQLAFILCHPAMLRRLHLAFEETQPRAVRDNFAFYKRRDIRSDYWTSTHHEFIDVQEARTGQQVRAHVWFLTPEVHPETLWPGRVLSVAEVELSVGRPW